VCTYHLLSHYQRDPTYLAMTDCNASAFNGSPATVGGWCRGVENLNKQAHERARYGNSETFEMMTLFDILALVDGASGNPARNWVKGKLFAPLQ